MARKGQIQSFRQVKVDPVKCTYDDKTQEFTMITDVGYEITVKVNPAAAVDAYTPTGGNLPLFNISLNPQFVRTLKHDKALNQKDLIKYVKKRSVLAPHMKLFDEFRVGFIYSNNLNDPNNHMWMFEFLKNKQHIQSIMFDMVNMTCAFTTTSWHDGIFHGRYLVRKEDVNFVREEQPGTVTIEGPVQSHPLGDLTLLPKDTTEIRLRFDVKIDYWFIDFLDKDRTNTGESIKVKTITGDVPLYGEIDWNHPKPWVATYSKVTELASFQLMGTMLILQGLNLQDPTKTKPQDVEPEPEVASTTP